MIFTTAVAAVAAACAPLPALANPNEAPAAAKSKSDIKYETFSDPKELEPYFQNAEGKQVTFKLGEQKKIGAYLVSVDKEGTGVDFRVAAADGSIDEFGISVSAPLPEVSVLVVDVPASNPYIKGKMLVFSDNDSVYFQYFNKREGRHETRGVPLYEGKMRSGPIKTGFGIDNGAIFVINSPERLQKGDVVCQATIRPNGDSGPYWYKYEGPDTAPDTRTVAMH
ncbi:MAG: hypothetical protein GY852_06715 [bacterium]|nr:hypothetical protein [bacterium]